MMPPPQSLVVNSTSCRCISCYSVSTWLCAPKASMARWKPHTSPSKSFPSGMLLPPVNLPTNCNWWQWTLAGCRLGPQLPPFALSLLHWSYPTSSRHCWMFQWHNCSNQPAADRYPSVTAAGFSQHSTPRKVPPSAALGALPAAKESEDPFQPEGTDSIPSVPMATLLPAIQTMAQMSLLVPIQAGTLSFAHITPWILQSNLPKTLQMASLPFITRPQAPTMYGPTGFSDRLPPAAGESEHCPRVITCELGHCGFLPQRAVAKCRTHSMPEWCPGCQGHKRGRGAPHNHSLCPTTSSQGQCASTGAQGKGGGGVESPSLLGGHVSLSAQVPWGTPVPPTAPDQWFALSCHSRDVSHSPATGHGRQRVSISTSHPMCVRDSSATSRWKMLVQFLRPRCICHEAGWKGGCQHLWPEAKGGKAGSKGPKGTPGGGLLWRIWHCEGSKMGLPEGPLDQIWAEWSYDLSSVFW